LPSTDRPWFPFYDPGVSPELPALAFETIGDMARHVGATFGAKTAFRTIMPNGMAGAMSFAQTIERAAAFAAYLREDLKLSPGDRVAIQAPNGLAYPVVALGTLIAGLVLVNVNPLYVPEETAGVLRDSRPKVVVVIDMFADRLAKALSLAPVDHVVLTRAAEFFPFLPRSVIGIAQRYVRKQIPPAPFAHIRLPEAIARGMRHAPGDGRRYARDVGPDSIACLQYTGGTTGTSKGAMLTHHNLIANVQQFHAFGDNGIVLSDVVLTALPLYHIFAFTVNFFGAFVKGAENILIPSPRPLSNLVKPFEIGRPTFLTGVNTLFNGLLNEPWFRDAPPKSLRKSVAGGMALQTVVAERWLSVTGTPVVEGYGLTEASPVVTFNPFIKAKPGTIGIPLPGTDILIMGEDGKPVAPGQPGELVVSGPQVMRGYWERPDETATVLRDGWLYTGDIATMDADGFVTIVDRLKDMIIVSGFNVYPNEVEAVLARMPGVKECAVIGVPDSGSGEAVKAFIVSADATIDADAVRRYCRDHLTGYKIPRIVEFRDELPKTPVGKILRRELRT
jgi:long-chain acyl-CoA synthetase